MTQSSASPPRKPSILFVDDESNILVGLRRMLHGQRTVWDMTFAEGGPQAMALLCQQAFDVVVSDMRMPELDGAQLLSEVEKRHPSTIRIVLSGYSETSSVLKTAGPAHQYMAKPCDPATLIDIIRRALTLKRLLADECLRQLVTSLRGLPSPSPLFLQLMEEINSETSSAASVSKLIASDVAMSASLLKMTNSAFFSSSGRATTPLQAVRMLGLETIKALVLTAGLFHPFAGRQNLAPLLDKLNHHSWLVAHVAREIAATLRLGSLGEEQAFCAGMMSHVGTLVLLDRLPKQFSFALSQVSETIDLSQAERKTFGACHAELGGYLLGLWGFPAATIDAVIWQHAPSRCTSDPATAEHASVTTAVHAALALAPPFPLLPPTIKAPAVQLDQTHLQQAAVEHLLPEWQRLSQHHQFAEAS